VIKLSCFDLIDANKKLETKWKDNRQQLGRNCAGERTTFCGRV